MVNQEFLDEPVGLTGSFDPQGHTVPQSLTWRGKQYTIVTVGRQWDEDEGRNVLTEAADGTRFELQLRRRDLIWHVKRVWRAQAVV